MPTLPTPIDDLPEVPDPDDRSTFSVRAVNYFQAIKNSFVGKVNALAANVYANALEALASATATADAAAAATAAAGATPWVSGVNGSVGERKTSPANGRLYRRLMAGAWTTDPSLDPTNWALVDTDLVLVDVTGTSQTAVAGYHYVLTNVAATAVAAPASFVKGDRFRVTPANGLKTNTINVGSATVVGPSGTATGVITLDLGATMELRAINTTTWVSA